MKNIRRKLNKIFNHMYERCYNQSDKRYYDWGGRGIKICKEWLDDKENFINWALKNGYEEGLTIDRIDNNKGYYPENCRWVTLKENNQNRRSSRFYTINGETVMVGANEQILQKNDKIAWEFIDFSSQE